jgi:hypothetical protein
MVVRDTAAVVQMARESYAELGMTPQEADQHIIETAVRVAKFSPNLKAKACAVIEYVSKNKVKKE